ncbi:hypothetical protein NKH77_07635 [Streptomyces sp. M19]
MLVPHRGIVNRLAWMREEYRLDAGERVLHKTPSDSTSRGGSCAGH